MAGTTAAGLGAILASHAPEADAGTPSDPVKLVCAIRRRADLSPAQFYDYWLNHHGPLAVEQITVLGGYRYVQSHTADPTQNLLLAAARGTGEAFDGIVEVWFPSEQAVIAAFATPAGVEANDRLTQDEQNFIDLARSSYFVTNEHVLLG
ncbi:EthD domain-containing protein [Nocardia sp. NPDC052112]|uniref:EthD domain-containing protein n=1 Tax=Nocardia sp. NPDC052112 TaxID=3155646 RepID=UPI00342F8BB4